MIGAAAVGAYAVTMLVRSTVFTLGAMFAVVVGATCCSRWSASARRGSRNKNLGAVIWNGTTYYVDPPEPASRAPAAARTASTAAARRGSTCWTGVRNLGVLLAGAAALSVWSFRRRDVP